MGVAADDVVQISSGANVSDVHVDVLIGFVQTRQGLDLFRHLMSSIAMIAFTASGMRLLALDVDVVPTIAAPLMNDVAGIERGLESQARWQCPWRARDTSP